MVDHVIYFRRQVQEDAKKISKLEAVITDLQGQFNQIRLVINHTRKLLFAFNTIPSGNHVSPLFISHK